jgi:hypothetical protein
VACTTDDASPQRPQRRLASSISIATWQYLDEKIGYVDAVNPDLSKFKKSGGGCCSPRLVDTGITPGDHLC